MKQKRVLHWGLMDTLGGVETFVINIYRHIDKEKIQFDFLTMHNQNVAFSDEIEAMGGKIYKCIYSKHESMYKHKKSYDDFFANHHDYKAVHMHMNFPRYIAPLKYAKKYGIEKRIYHAHNSKDMYPSSSFIVNMRKRITEEYTIQNLKKYSTDLFACSRLAAEYMYHGKYDYKFIPNAIETDRYLFNKTIRKKKRYELNLGDKFVIGTVGRLQYQKNSEFTIEIFHEVHKRNKNSVLIMVGEGDLKQKLVEMAKAYNIIDSIMFLGSRNDVPELMQAFDCFLLPSRFEGLPVVLVEAQTAGLPCFASDTITNEVNITPLIHFHSIQEDNANLWSESILKTNIQRRNMKSDVVKAGFDIKDLATKMTDYYLK